jgi:membrane protease YdiL (CAAX protease family)
VEGRPLRQAAAFAAWLVLVGLIFDLGVYRLPLHGWEPAGAQAGAYAVLIAPIAVWSGHTFRTLATPPWQAIAGLVLVMAALAYEAAAQHLGSTAIAQNAVRYLAAGVGEEVAFRGFLWERTRAAGLALGWVVTVNVAGFTAWHLISVAAGLSQLSGLISVAVLGLVFCLVRLWSGNTGLPALLHVASDIAGI